MLAKYVLEHNKLDKILFVISPQNPFKSQTSLVRVEDRINMVLSAIQTEKRFELCDYEVNNEFPSYSYKTIEYLKEKYPNDELFFIMGMDNWIHINKWKNYKYIINNVSFIVIPRIGTSNITQEDLWFNKIVELIKDNNVVHSQIAINAPLMNISSTFIRNEIKCGNDVNFYVPREVYDVIKTNNLYD